MIRLFNDAPSVSRAAADLFAQNAREAVDRRGQFNVALSGGYTPQPTYRLLAQPPWRDQIPWRDIRVFWGDERCVADDDERNNARMARDALLNRVPVDGTRVHPIRCAGEPGAGAARYDALLRTHLPAKAPVLDLVFLGLGQNGHTASLFPYDPALEEKARWAVAVDAAGQEIPRVSLTPPVINAARVIAFLVYGRDKAQILKSVLEGPPDPRRLPAQLIRPSDGRMIWLVDEAAAALLDKRICQPLGENQ